MKHFTSKSERKFQKVMHEFGQGELRSHDKKVTDQKQALAIAFSEARKVYPNYGMMKKAGEVKAEAVKGVFSLDAMEGKDLPGYTFGDTWNGFAVPYFERPEANLIMEALGGTYKDGAYLFDDGYGGEDEYEKQTIQTVDGPKDVYAIGAYSWVWFDDLMKNGGGITANQAAALAQIYKTGTAKELWGAWTPENRVHWLMDHAVEFFELMGNDYTKSSAAFAVLSYDALPSPIKKSLLIHHAQGMYRTGGSIASRFWNTTKKHTKTAFEKSKELAGKGYEKTKAGLSQAKAYTEKKIHDQKRDIALKVLDETRDNSDTKGESRILKQATNLVEENYAGGGEIQSTWHNWTGDQKFYFLSENGFKAFVNVKKSYNELDEEIKSKLKSFLEKHPNYIKTSMARGGGIPDFKTQKEAYEYLKKDKYLPGFAKNPPAFEKQINYIEMATETEAYKKLRASGKESYPGENFREAMKPIIQKIIKSKVGNNKDEFMRNIGYQAASKSKTKLSVVLDNQYNYDIMIIFDYDRKGNLKKSRFIHQIKEWEYSLADIEEVGGFEGQKQVLTEMANEIGRALASNADKYVRGGGIEDPIQKLIGQLTDIRIDLEDEDEEILADVSGQIEEANSAQEVEKILSDNEDYINKISDEKEIDRIKISIAQYRSSIMLRGGGVESKSTVRANRSELLKYANFGDESHINLIRLNPFKRQGLKYKDENKYAISVSSIKDGQKVFKFKTLEEAEKRFDRLVNARKASVNLLKEGKTNNYPSVSSMAKGGGADEGVDLFEDYKNIPPKIQRILDKHAQGFEDGDYAVLKQALEEVEKQGYTFDYYLDGIAYDLRKIGQKGKVAETVKLQDEAWSKAGGGGIEEKQFLSKDLSGRGEKSYTLTESHIRKTWDLDETDDDDQTLKDFLDNSDDGDSWKNGTEYLENIGTGSMASGGEIKIGDLVEVTGGNPKYIGTKGIVGKVYDKEVSIEIPGTVFASVEKEGKKYYKDALMEKSMVKKISSGKLSPAKQKLLSRINTLKATKANADAAAQKAIQKKIDVLQNQFDYNPSAKERAQANKGKFALDVPAKYSKAIYKKLWSMHIRPSIHTLNGTSSIVVSSKLNLDKAYTIFSDMLKEKGENVPSLAKISRKL